MSSHLCQWQLGQIFKSPSQKRSVLYSTLPYTVQGSEWNQWVSHNISNCSGSLGQKLKCADHLQHFHQLQCVCWSMADEITCQEVFFHLCRWWPLLDFPPCRQCKLVDEAKEKMCCAERFSAVHYMAHYQMFHNPIRSYFIQITWKMHSYWVKGVKRMMHNKECYSILKVQWVEMDL